MLSMKAWLVVGSFVLVGLGAFIRWKTARYDLKDAAIDSAWTLARRKRTAENPTALEVKLGEITSQPTWSGRAKRAAGTAAGHFAAQVLGVVAMVFIALGLALGAFAIFGM